MPALKAAAVWLLVLVCAVLNGAFREGFLVPHLGEVTAFAASGLILSLCIVALSVILVPWIGRLSARNYILLGLFWLSLTLVFEFGFGLAQHKTWEQLLAAYTFRGGNIWPIVLAVTTLAPLLAARLRGLVQPPRNGA